MDTSVKQLEMRGGDADAAGQPAGVMDASYATDRAHKPHLIFRLRSRAVVAAEAYHRFGSGRTRPTILDLGAAEGETMRELHRLLDADESIGIEYSQHLIRAARPLPRGCTLIEGDAAKAADVAGQNRFDLVTALAMLEHVPFPELVVQGVHKVLRPGGIFVATCPVGAWDTISGALRLHHEEHHERKVDRESFERLSTEAGLEPIHYERFMFAPVAFLPYLGIAVPVTLAHRIDRWVWTMRVFGTCFVNQQFVARRR